METTFADLAVGQQFDFNVDADGYELIYYKISEDEGYAFAGNRAGRREKFAPDTIVYSNGTMHRISPTTVTDIERVAITLIADNPATHPGLGEWLRAIISNPKESRRLDKYIWEENVTLSSDETLPLRTWLQREGYVCWGREWDTQHSAAAAILDHQPRGEYPADKGEWFCAHNDAALLCLGDAIVDYRTAGRPNGDQTHTIMGLGAPLLRITSSLAAAIVEFVRSVQNNIWNMHRE